MAVETYAYDEFGQGGATGASSYPWRYTGQRLDPWTGSYHYKARQYAPRLGRFLQPDPAGFVDGPNVYAYGINSPLVYNDPNGEDVVIYRGGNTIHLIWYVNFTSRLSSENARPHAEHFIAAVEDQWSGQHGRYNVRAEVRRTNVDTPEFLINTVNIVQGWGRSSVRSEREMTIYTQSTGWTAAHEFGHLARIYDLYGEHTGPQSGWEGDIMAVQGGEVTEQTIDLLLNLNRDWTIDMRPDQSRRARGSIRGHGGGCPAPRVGFRCGGGIEFY